MKFSEKLSTEDYLKLKNENRKIKEINDNLIKNSILSESQIKSAYSKHKEEQDIQRKVNLIVNILLEIDTN